MPPACDERLQRIDAGGAEAAGILLGRPRPADIQPQPIGGRARQDDGVELRPQVAGANLLIGEGRVR